MRACDMKSHTQQLCNVLSESPADPWVLTDVEWERLGHLLSLPNYTSLRAGTRETNNRRAAQACLYRHYRTNTPGSRCFGWNDLPATLGVSPSSANRRFRAWTAMGAWRRFWFALLTLRGHGAPPPPEVWKERSLSQFPAGDILAELERAYSFFNGRFFGGDLPQSVAILLEGRRVSEGSIVGQYCSRAWHRQDVVLNQISLSTLALGKDSNAALAVLLHEMVHLRNSVFGLDDCHPRNQYHSRNFRDVAVLAGLDCAPRDHQIGYALTSLSDEGRCACAELSVHPALFDWVVS